MKRFELDQLISQLSEDLTPVRRLTLVKLSVRAFLLCFAIVILSVLLVAPVRVDVNEILVSTGFGGLLFLPLLIMSGAAWLLATGSLAGVQERQRKLFIPLTAAALLYLFVTW